MSINHVKYVLPKELLSILEKIYSEKQLDTIYRSFKNGRNVTLRVNLLKGNVKEVMDELSENRIKATNHSIIKNAFILKGTKESSIRKLEVYKHGKIYMQNLSSMLPPLFLDLNKGQTILDMCAAPGGKSLYMADLTNNEANIFANDMNEIRRERLTYNIEKQGAESVVVLGTDGCKIGKMLHNYFDSILLDAPCAGEGTIHLKGTRAYKGWNDKKIRNNVKLQKKLIESAYYALKDKGILVYSTCTLNPYENEEIIEYAINKFKDLKIENINLNISNVMNGLNSYDGKQYNKELEKSIRIIPNDIMEGFYICKLVKTSKE